MNNKILKTLGLKDIKKNEIYPSLLIGNSYVYGKKDLKEVHSPINGKTISSFKDIKPSLVNKTLNKLNKSFKSWSKVPAPKRALLIKEISRLASKNKKELAYVITLESGKIYEEALGEVQEFIDICDFAIGLSRQLYGLSISSERYKHKIYEQWYPLGTVSIISAFNFPMAVWAWNAILALVCGNTILWKPSSQTPLCAIACFLLVQKALKKFKDYPQDILALIISSRSVSQKIIENKKSALISATGSVQMGKNIAPLIAKRLGKSLFELGGNNALIICKSADINLAIEAVVFSAIGTAGQRCTSLRRLYVHKSLIKEVKESLISIYKNLKIGNPFNVNNLMGPLINKESYKNMQKTLKTIKKQGGAILYGGKRIKKTFSKSSYYVKPALVKIEHKALLIQNETFAPILYIIEFENIKEAIFMNNDVPQGLSSSIFTQDLKEAELFTSSFGSDCGIVNVNVGTSGAEIGAAFGGEKDTGGGRESGSDSWKNYMRRQSCTINYSNKTILSQGLKFSKSK